MDPLEEEVFMSQLHKAIYGLKPAQSDNSPFISRYSGALIYLLVYVDFIISSPNLSTINKFLKAILIIGFCWGLLVI